VLDQVDLSALQCTLSLRISSLSSYLRQGRPRCEGLGISPPENLWKLICQILHSGDYLLRNFLLFENYGQEVGGKIHCWSPNLKVGRRVSPGPYGCCAYDLRAICCCFIVYFFLLKQHTKRTKTARNRMLLWTVFDMIISAITPLSHQRDYANLDRHLRATFTAKPATECVSQGLDFLPITSPACDNLSVLAIVFF